MSASGKIQPKRLVNISADTSGRVVNLAVNEGDRVAKGQFLLQIDPKSLRTRVDSGTASLEAAESSLDQQRQAVETSRVQLDQARKTLARQQDLWNQQLTTRESLEKADSDVKAAESTLHEREKLVSAQSARIGQERATLESARYDLSKVRIESPIDGIVTRRNIQEGETAVIGTMNNAGTVLLTLADMSVIQAEVEVDETNIPNVTIGQLAKITIDALPDRTFKGHVSEIGNSPIQPAGTSPRYADDAGHQLQGAWSCSTNRFPTCVPGSPARRTSRPRPGRRDSRSDSCRRRPRTRLRRQRADREAAAGGEEAQAHRSAAAGPGARARPDAQGSRRRVRPPHGPGGVHSHQARNLRRQVLRGARRTGRRATKS